MRVLGGGARRGEARGAGSVGGEVGPASGPSGGQGHVAACGWPGGGGRTRPTRSGRVRRTEEGETRVSIRIWTGRTYL